MCGIFGFHLNRPLDEADLRLGKQGMDALRHRGPDHGSFWADREKGVFLGHRRLSIIDVSEKSNQPMARGGDVLVYNGEIYNYREIAKDLAQGGVLFDSKGDTEVLIQAWRKWGSACVDRFDGMYAFALYGEGTLRLATDPFGEKPLYWVETEDGLYFSSEPNPLVKLLDLSPEFTPADVTAFLCLGFLPGERTGYRGLRRMDPGTWLTYAEGQTQIRRHYQPPQPEPASGRVRDLSERDLDAIAGALVDSLRVRLRADVPLGIFLSAGVDSLLVAALAARELGCKALALTVKFPDRETHDESREAAEAAGYLGLPHEIIDSGEDPARMDPSLIFDLFGEANDNITVAAAYQMSLVAASRLKVALSGMGGDEMFYGYNKYLFMYKWRHLLKLGATSRNRISTLFKAISPRRFNTPRILSSTSDATRFLAVKNFAAWEWMRELPGLEGVAGGLFPPGKDICLSGRQFDLTQTMPCSFIPAMERGSMRASLEVRTPFLSRDLLQVLSGFDQRSFLAFGQKAALRRILGRYLPVRLFDFPKRGFNYPKGLLLGARSPRVPRIPYIDEPKVAELWNQRHKKDWQSFAVRLTILEHFLEKPAPIPEAVALRNG